MVFEIVSIIVLNHKCAKLFKIAESQHLTRFFLKAGTAISLEFQMAVVTEIVKVDHFRAIVIGDVIMFIPLL